MMTKRLRYKKKKTESKIRILVPFFIIFVMVFSTIGFILGQNNDGDDDKGNAVSYDGFDFYPLDNGKWTVRVGGKDFLFDNLPDELSDIDVPYFVIPSKVYALFDPADKDARVDYSLAKLEYNLNNIGKKVVFGCASEEECPDIPLKNCNEDFAFYLKKGKDEVKGRVFTEGECIVLEGDSLWMIRAVDKISLNLAGVVR